MRDVRGFGDLPGNLTKTNALRVTVGLAAATLVLLTAACGGGASAGEISSYSAPAARSEGEWQLYQEAPEYDASASRGVYPGGASPEAAVVHFYASRVRGDGRFREVLAAERSKRLERGLDEYEEWTFKRFRLVGRKERSPDTYWVKIWFEIEVGGDVDDGQDEVTVRREGDGWRIAEVPS
jgi:hypothetical protein